MNLKMFQTHRHKKKDLSKDNDAVYVVMNLSDHVLSDREEFLLSFGLQFFFQCIA